MIMQGLTYDYSQASHGMACICQYFLTGDHCQNTTGSDSVASEPNSAAAMRANVKATGDKPFELFSKLSRRSVNTSKDKSLNGSQEVSASELAASRAESWVLKKRLNEAELNIETLEDVMRTIIVKQNELLGELYEVKRQNIELQNECSMQRDYQAMERNALVRELHDIKTLLANRTRQLQTTTENNAELTSALQSANEKIFMMGIKFLKLQSRFKRSASNLLSPTSSDRSS